MITVPPVKHVLSRLFPKKEELSTKQAFFIKQNYRHRIAPKYQDLGARSSKIIWQPDVYNVTSLLARKFECSHILDVGCGTAGKLVSMFPEFEIIGIDHGKNILHCKRKYEFGTWIEANLEKQESIKISEDILKKTAIVCSDVIEHVVNPTYLLENLKNWMNYSPVAIITTPERDLTRGKNHFGPPPNQHHIREWNLEEYEKLLQSYNFNLAFLGLTASNNEKFELKTMIAGIGNNKLKNSPEELKDLKSDHTKILKNFFE